MGLNGFTGKAIVKIQDASSDTFVDFAEFHIMGNPAVEHDTADRSTESHPEGLVTSASKGESYSDICIALSDIQWTDSGGLYGKALVEIYRGTWTSNGQDIIFNIEPEDVSVPYIRLEVQNKKYKKPSRGE